ncbi:MAG: sensor histidine kinase [Planctomycetaceae bacterium]
MSAVLIVDDDAADRASFRDILSRAGYTVHELSMGRDALARAKEIRPHAIVLDVDLLDADGPSVCRELRADREFAGVPILMLTVRDDESDILAALGAGADDYVAKGAPREILLARVRRLIQYRQMATVAVLNEHLVQVGRLLAGIVHEIRGPLAVIRGSAELMRLHLGPDDVHLQWVEPILRNTELLQVRLEHLMATVRGGPMVLRTVEITPVVREAADLFFKGSDPRGCRMALEARFEDALPSVRADAGRLVQVLISLFCNAREAIAAARRDEGRITVWTRTGHDQGKDWVLIDVADDGPGIPDALLERIFDPFVTTKEAGTGFGLYLASENLCDQHGRLTVRNRPDGGACFTVWLPLAEVPAST